MHIEIVEQTADGLTHQELSVPEGATIENALNLARRKVPEGYGLSVYGLKSSLLTVLHDGDRIEFCRPLLVDPKEARRLRAKKAGLKSTGVRRHAR